MSIPRRRRRSKALLAVPFVITVLGPTACADRVYTNPTPPTRPTVDDDAAVVTTTDPPVQATDAAAPQTGLPDPPNDGSGHLVVADNGDCLWQYNPPEMHCPPHAYCNPGPPRQPLHVKCPNGAKPPTR